MDKKIKIRKVEENDAKKWYKFVNKVWRDAYKNIFPEEVFLEKEKNTEEKEKHFNENIYNSNDKIALVAENEDRIIGIMFGVIKSNYEYFNSEYADLVGLYIDPNFQRKGRGSTF